MVPGPVAAKDQTRFVGLIRHIRPEALDWRRFSYTGGDPMRISRGSGTHNFYGGTFANRSSFSRSAYSSCARSGRHRRAVTSGLFSWLTVVAAYLIGSATFNVWVGLGAAAALSIERDDRTGAMGYRDDAFAFFVVLTAYGSLLVLERPSRTDGRGGVIASAACLSAPHCPLVCPACWRLLDVPRPSASRSVGGCRAQAIVPLCSAILINCYVVGTMFYP
jgi:hypothetical protein